MHFEIFVKLALFRQDYLIKIVWNLIEICVKLAQEISSVLHMFLFCLDRDVQQVRLLVSKFISCIHYSMTHTQTPNF